jgi:hypothetical protein
MQCQTCGRDWPDEFEFCPKCGLATLASDGSAAAASRGIAKVGERPVATSGDIEGGATWFVSCSKPRPRGRIRCQGWRLERIPHLLCVLGVLAVQ